MRPIWRIEADGADITRRLAASLEQLSVTDAAGVTADQCEITIEDAAEDLDPPRYGVELAIFMGYAETNLALMGRFQVTEAEVSGPPTRWRIRGASADFREGLKVAKSGSWSSTTLGNLVRDVAERNGLTAAVAPHLADMPLGQVHQSEESDIHLLTRLAQKHGAIVKLADGKIVVTERARAMSASGAPLEPIDIRQTERLRWSATVADRPAVGAVRARWHDVAAATRDAVTVRLAYAAKEAPVHELRDIFADRTQAAAAAKAEVERLMRLSARFRLSVVGDPRIMAETPFRLLGAVSSALVDTWIATRVTHTLTGAGYQTDIEAERPAAVEARRRAEQDRDAPPAGKLKGAALAEPPPDVSGVFT